MDIELHDWEVLDDDHTAVNPTGYLDGIEQDSEGMIRSNHFSLDAPTYPLTHLDDVTDHASVESDNPSWIDPVCEVSYSITKPIGEASSTDGDDDGRYAVNNNDLSAIEVENKHVGYDQIENRHVGCDQIEAKPKPKPSECDKVDEEKVVKKVGGVGVGVWWKIPLDLVKYCLFKASPVWSLSVAAAMMGVVILGRRLYKMKQKTRTMQLKVAVDDKKVSQVLSRAARLNEAFSVVKRGPIIRPSLPGAGIAPWPVMALR